MTPVEIPIEIAKFLGGNMMFSMTQNTMIFFSTDFGETPTC
jgi:hypothetical protein